eukprot:TRINITY_DN9697_c0_g1_i1.p1 TRINITY_DN9697_c0_g1~~TRINITY_DN9697_c0_g1_i1.p1  ORF type:complete len:966 (+),score=220.87 TRINITY_DN9697_c0_g1_i1:84-2981(+)
MAGVPEFAQGRHVCLTGLQGRPELNGRVGTIVGKDAESGRYMVQLPRAAGAEKEQVKAKPQNVVDHRHAWWAGCTADECTGALTFFVESARLRVEDEYIMGDVVGAYAEAAGGMPGEAMRWLKRYVRQAARRGALPPWWCDQTTEKLAALAGDKSGGSCIGHAVEAADVLKKWGRDKLAQMRELADAILGGVDDPFTEDEDDDDDDVSDDLNCEGQGDGAAAPSGRAFDYKAERIKEQAPMTEANALRCVQFAEGATNRRLDAASAPSGGRRVSALHVVPTEGVTNAHESATQEAEYGDFFGLARYLQDAGLSRFTLPPSETGSNGGTEEGIDPRCVDLRGVKSLTFGRPGTGDLELTDFDGGELAFPNLEAFEFVVGDGYGLTYDLRGIANPVWAKSLTSLTLSLGPCHICEGRYGLDVLAPLVNLRCVTFGDFRHAGLADLKVVEHFKQLERFAYTGSIRGIEHHAQPVLDLATHQHLKHIRFEPYWDTSDLQFCMASERRGGIALLLPHLDASGGAAEVAASPGAAPCTLEIVHKNIGKFTQSLSISRALRAALRSCALYALQETTAEHVRRNNGMDVVTKDETSDAMDALARDLEKKANERELDTVEKRIAEEAAARAGLAKVLKAAGGATKNHDLRSFPPALHHHLGGQADVDRWVKSGTSQLRPKADGVPQAFAKGDRCYALVLMENTYRSREPREVHGHWYHRNGHVSGPISWAHTGFGSGQVLSNMYQVLDSGVQGARGAFLLECLVEGKRPAQAQTRARLRAALGSPEGAPCDEWEYNLRVSHAAPGKVTTTLHESFLFPALPDGWAAEGFKVWKNNPDDGTKEMSYVVHLPPGHHLTESRTHADVRAPGGLAASAGPFCNACADYLPKTAFSKTQLKNPAATRRCKRCVTGGVGLLDDYYSGDDDDEEDFGGMYGGMYGFSGADVEELLCQGVKPWDDDADAVLDALYDYDDYGY